MSAISEEDGAPLYVWLLVIGFISFIGFGVLLYSGGLEGLVKILA